MIRHPIELYYDIELTRMSFLYIELVSLRDIVDLLICIQKWKDKSFMK